MDGSAVTDGKGLGWSSATVVQSRMENNRNFILCQSISTVWLTFLKDRKENWHLVSGREKERERPEGLRPQDYLESYFALGSKGSLMVCRCTVCRRVGKDRNTLDLSETVQHV